MVKHRSREWRGIARGCWETRMWGVAVQWVWIFSCAMNKLWGGVRILTVTLGESERLLQEGRLTWKKVNTDGGSLQIIREEDGVCFTFSYHSHAQMRKLGQSEFRQCLRADCYNKLPETGWLKKQTFISHFSRGWKSDINASENSVSGESPTSWFIDCHLLAVSSHGGRDKGLLWVLFNEGTNPKHEDPILTSQWPSNSPPSKTVTLGIRTSIYEFWGTQTFRP